MNKPFRTMAFRTVFGSGILSLLLLAGCRGEAPEGNSGFVMDVGISPTPPGVGPARLIVTLEDTAGNPVSGASIAVEGNMSHAGMAPVLDTAVSLPAPGQYLVEDFTFTMAGDWILSLEATIPDGQVATHRINTNVVSAPPGIPPVVPPTREDTSGQGGHVHEPSPNPTGGGH